MINVLVHNLAKGEFMEDGVQLNSTSEDINSAAYRIRKDLGLTSQDVVISPNDIGCLIGFMSAFPWIEEILSPTYWDIKTYIPSRFTSKDWNLDIGHNETAKFFLNKLDKKDIQEMLTNVGHFSDYVTADSDEEKLCWILLGIALSTKFYTSD